MFSPLPGPAQVYRQFQTVRVQTQEMSGGFLPSITVPGFCQTTIHVGHKISLADKISRASLLMIVDLGRWPQVWQQGKVLGIVCLPASYPTRICPRVNHSQADKLAV